MYSKTEKICCISIVYLLIIIFVPNHLYAIEIKAEEEYRVLIINSYNSMTTWTNNLIETFVKNLEDISDEVVEVRMEYLNAITNSEQGYRDSFREMLNSKYKSYNADLIVTIGLEAFVDIREEVLDEESVFYQTPIVFSGVAKYAILDVKEENITGDFCEINFTKMINLIMELNSELSKIKIVLVKSDLDEIPLYQKRQELIEKLYSGYVQIEFIREDYIEEVLKNIEEEDKECAILIGGNYYSEEVKRLLNSSETVHKIKEISQAPIYTYDETYIMGGATGGNVWPAEAIGINLAEDVRCILFEKEMPDMAAAQTEYIFNYEEIYRNDIIINQIPKQSTIINRKWYQLLIPKKIKLIIENIVRVILIIIICILFYIYKQKQIAKKSKKLYEQATLQEQIRTDFITGLSHDLKTPINIIRSSVELMSSLDEEVEKEYLSKRMKVINQNANRLLRLVNNLMDLIKLEESSYYKMNLLNVNLVEVVEDICVGAVDYMKQRELTFVFDTEEEEIITAIDSEKIERVILNLLSNAIKFTPPQGNIYVDIKRVDDKVRILIKDSGVGIAKDKLEAIFLKFYQVDNNLTKPGEGSGIGLYIVKKLVELHEGSITAESKLGEGTDFIILLPIKVLEESKKTEIEIRNGMEQIIQLEFSDL